MVNYIITRISGPYKVNRTCVSCLKDCKNSETVKCHVCKKHTHKPCALKTISDVSLDCAVVENAFVQPEYNDDYEVLHDLHVRVHLKLIQEMRLSKT